jgi:hypothetical protein
MPKIRAGALLHKEGIVSKIGSGLRNSVRRGDEGSLFDYRARNSKAVDVRSCHGCSSVRTYEGVRTYILTTANNRSCEVNTDWAVGNDNLGGSHFPRTYLVCST